MVLGLSETAAAREANLSQKAMALDSLRVPSPPLPEHPFSGWVRRWSPSSFPSSGSCSLTPANTTESKPNHTSAALRRASRAVKMVLASCSVSRGPRGWGAIALPHDAGSPVPPIASPRASSSAFSVREEQTRAATGRTQAQGPRLRRHHRDYGRCLTEAVLPHKCRLSELLRFGLGFGSSLCFSNPSSTREALHIREGQARG